MGLTLDVGSANPDAAREASRELSQAAAQAADLGVQITLAISGTVGQGVWTGTAAEAFVNHMESRARPPARSRRACSRAPRSCPPTPTN